MSNLLSPTEAADQWGIHRTILYKKMRSGNLSYTKDVSSSGKSRRLIDPVEMLRVFGEPEPTTCKSEIEHETVTTPPDTSIYMDYIEQLKEQLAKKDAMLDRQADLLESKEEQVRMLIDQLNDVNQRLLPAPMDDMDDDFEYESPKLSKRKWWRFGRKTEGADS